MSARDLAVGDTGLAVDDGSIRLHGTRLRDTWLVRRREWVLLFGAYVALAAVWTAIGLLLTHQLADSWLTRSDLAAERWFVAHRTSALNSWSSVLSMAADTVVKVAVTTAIALVLLVRFRRWKETLMIVAALVLEAMTFITVTWIVNRPRPDVPRLDSSPVGSSFPSGHVAASVAYAAIVVVIFEHTRRRLPRVLGVVVVAALTLGVAFSRMYRGMHHPTDVVMGAILGGVAVCVTVVILRDAARRRAADTERRPVAERTDHAAARVTT
ncbi:MAG: phosphatase PAP2 family protein [Ilumatobacteraceae bacterium]